MVNNGPVLKGKRTRRGDGFGRRQEGVALVREAGNGAEALKLLSEEPFEIMITDIIMPQMDGYALLEEMRRFLPEIFGDI